jgi:hypothetical protein
MNILTTADDALNALSLPSSISTDLSLRLLSHVDHGFPDGDSAALPADHFTSSQTGRSSGFGDGAASLRTSEGSDIPSRSGNSQ